VDYVQRNSHIEWILLQHVDLANLLWSSFAGFAASTHAEGYRRFALPDTAYSSLSYNVQIVAQLMTALVNFTFSSPLVYSKYLSNVDVEHHSWTVPS
jgi:hypothetical protein